LDRVYPNDPSTDEDVRKAPLVFIPVFHGPVQGGHWALLVIDRTEYEPGIFNRIPNASQSQTVPFRNVTFSFGNGASDEMQFGHAGREHIATSSLSEVSIDINSPFLGLAHLSFTE
jgi:hypothetical protein